MTYPSWETISFPLRENGLADLIDMLNFKILRFCNNTDSTCCQQNYASQDSIHASAQSRREENHIGKEQPTVFELLCLLSFAIINFNR